MASSSPSSGRSRTQIKFLTYNVCSREHVAVYRRIRAICDIIQRHDPDVIFLQEVTRYIHSIFRKAPWWSQYRTTGHAWPRDHPTEETPTNHFCLTLIRSQEVQEGVHAAPAGLYTATASFPEVEGGTTGFHSGVLVSTCHLAGPTPSDVYSGVERGANASFFLDTLERCWYRNSVFGGDMNWDDDLDGPFPTEEHDGWVDAWHALRPGGGGGWTHVAAANPVRRGLGNRLVVERKRPDRFVCKLTDYNLDSIEMVGTDVVPCVSRAATTRGTHCRFSPAIASACCLPSHPGTSCFPPVLSP